MSQEALTLLKSLLEHSGETLAGSRSHITPSRPDLLFHYTNSSGMRGILESSRLWSTNHRFLNDSSEIGYGLTVFNAAVDIRLQPATDSVIVEFLKQSMATANAFEDVLDCYITCFCERDDLLNQWRVYAESGGGYALGFSAADLGKREEFSSPQQDFLVRKVIYDVLLQTQLISAPLDHAIAALSKVAKGKSIEEASALISECCDFVQAEIADYLVCFKHPAFAVEQEWRLVHALLPNEQDHVQFRDGLYGLTPYAELDVSPSAGLHQDRLPLKKITHGPTANADNVRFALQKLLNIKGYSEVEISGSALPVRGTL